MQERASVLGRDASFFVGPQSQSQTPNGRDLTRELGYKIAPRSAPTPQDGLRSSKLFLSCGRHRSSNVPRSLRFAVDFARRSSKARNVPLRFFGGAPDSAPEPNGQNLTVIEIVSRPNSIGSPSKFKVRTDFLATATDKATPLDRSDSL